MLETFQHNADFRKRDSEVYQQCKRFFLMEIVQCDRFIFLFQQLRFSQLLLND